MELEEIKKVWNSVDTRLQQQEVLKKVIMKDLLVSKSDKGLSRMINYDYFGLTLIVFGLSALIWVIYQYPHRPLYIRIGIYTVTVFLIYALIQNIIGLSKLQKIDFSVSVSENLKIISFYRIWCQKQLKITLLSIAVLLIVLIACFFKAKMPILSWIILFGAFGMGAVGTWWEYKRMYQKNIDIIQKSLEGLKELEEE